MYQDLKNEINQYITTNYEGAITGNILNGVLKDMIDALGETKWAGKHIAVLGDSITAGGHVTGALATIEGCTILNYGVGGSTITLNGNNDVRDFCTRFEEDIETDYGNGTQIDLFIMWGGVNDYAAHVDLGNISQANKQATFYASLHRLANDQLNLLGNKPIVWITPMHLKYNYPSWPNHTDWIIENGVFTYRNNSNKYLYEFADAIKEVASIYGIPVLDLYSTGPTPQKQSNLFEDGLHPNAAGGLVIAEKIHNFIKNI